MFIDGCQIHLYNAFSNCGATAISFGRVTLCGDGITDFVIVVLRNSDNRRLHRFLFEPKRGLGSGGKRFLSAALLFFHSVKVFVDNGAFLGVC